MAPPSYSDLGKSARDLFSKNYRKDVIFCRVKKRGKHCICLSFRPSDFGLVKLDVKTKTPAGVEFNVNGTSNNDTGRVSSSLETKYKVNQHGLTLTEKWNTDNILASEISMEDKLLKGLKLGVTGSFAPQSGKKNCTVKGAYKVENVNVNTDVDVDYAGVTLHGAGVLGYVVQSNAIKD